MHIVSSITEVVTAKGVSGITQLEIDTKMRGSSWLPTLITSLILVKNDMTKFVLFMYFQTDYYFIFLNMTVKEKQ